MSRSIPERESLTVEFKSDVQRLPDKELISAVVCLANTEGGDLYLGVENDGRVTGLHPDHGKFAGVVALVANRTVPPLGVRAEVLTVNGMAVGRLTIPKHDNWSPQRTGCCNGAD
jgi:ATP-dependent DNA helicase RecG